MRPGADDDAVLVEHRGLARARRRKRARRARARKPPSWLVDGRRNRGASGSEASPRRARRRRTAGLARWTVRVASASWARRRRCSSRRRCAPRTAARPTATPSPRRWPGVKRQKPSCVPSSRPVLVDDRALLRDEPVPPEERRGSRRRRGSTPPGSPALRAAARPARSASARVSSFVCVAERKPQPIEEARVEPREHVRTGPCSRPRRARAGGVRGAGRCARSGRSRGARRRRARRTRAARRNGSSRCTRCTGSASRRARSRGRTAPTIARRNSSRRSSVTCGSPRAWHVSRAAITALGEQQARSPSGPAGSIQSRSVTPSACVAARSSATALSTPPLIATATRSGCGSARKTCASAFASASTASVSPPTAAASSSVSPSSARASAGRVGGDDAVAVDGEADERELGAARRVSDDLDHRGQRSFGKMTGPLSGPGACSTLPFLGCAGANLASQVGALPSSGNASDGRGLPFTWCWFTFTRSNTHRVGRENVAREA